MTDDKKVKKVGVKEITREGFEYELTVNFNLDRDTHSAMASKDNTRLFDGRDPFVITEKTGEELREWVNSGAVDTTVASKAEKRTEISGLLATLGLNEEWLIEKVKKPITACSIEELDKFIIRLNELIAEKEAKSVNINEVEIPIVQA